MEVQPIVTATIKGEHCGSSADCGTTAQLFTPAEVLEGTWGERVTPNQSITFFLFSTLQHPKLTKEQITEQTNN